MSQSEFKDILWKMRHDAHQVHHHIADFILNSDDRDHPPKLASLVKKYRKMMAEADKAQATGD
jgi:hypothetical protein